jgi:DNA repair protein SbcC/Rad50
MIPQRIAVRGFLCYREEQEICFDSAALWMLAGLNGSGKSAVFDGMTYALFGGHRAGKEHAEELINKSCDRAAIELEFLLDGARYRIRRTLKRKRQGGATPTQQVYRWTAADGADGRWDEVPDTTNKRDFDRWVQENIGLTYDTFTASVLLMQGKAEKLLAAAPKERFEVLAGIVDLERYQRLHERADERRRRLKEQVEGVQHRLNEVAEVTAAELEAAQQRSAVAHEKVHESQGEAERLQLLEVQAGQWRDGQIRLVDVRRHWEHGRLLLADAETIERDAARLRELTEVLPHIRTALEQRERLAQTARNGALLVIEQRTLGERLGELTSSLEKERHQQESLQWAIGAAQQREQEVGAGLRELAALLAGVQLCEKQRQELARLDAVLAQLPPDSASAVVRAQEEHDRLLTLSQVLPLLERIHAERAELHRAREHRRAAAEEQERVQTHGEQLAAASAALSQELETAARARQQSADRAVETRTLLTHARQQLAQLEEISGAKVCRQCGQALTAEHVVEERGRREKARASAEADSRQAAEAQKGAAHAEEQLLVRKQEIDRQLTEARERFREHRGRQQECERDAQRHSSDCLRIYAELPDAFRSRIAPSAPEDWPAESYPGLADLERLRQEVQGKPEALRRLQEAQDVHERWSILQIERATTQRALEAQEASLPADVTSLRSRHAALEAEDAGLKADLKVRRAEWQAGQEAIERLNSEQRLVREQLADKGQLWSAAEARREECARTLERTRAALPPAWQTQTETAAAADLDRWQKERENLDQAGIEARCAELQQARAGLDALQRRLTELEEELDRVPAEGRCDPAVVRQRRAALRDEQAEREAELLQARQDHQRLIERRKRRQELTEEHSALDRQHNLYRLLADLLSRTRLQRDLVRQAERGIVDYANAVLDRLSDGQLCLRLRGEGDSEGGADQALQLEAHNRVTGQAPIGVAFLSGSQRFRVAVSLALGIGQYASRQHRPIESVIIDEGFGCLDRQGRQVMIQELQNLRGQLRCILLVSHQEEFAEAFADGYRFELTDGSTQVTRFQR